MRSVLWLIVGVVALSGCPNERPEPPKLLDTGWFEDTGAAVDPTGCTNKYVSWTPEDGTMGVYWRDKPIVYTTTNVQHAYQAWLETADGERVETTLNWEYPAEEPGITNTFFTLGWEGNLEASTDYVLGLQDCAEIRYTTFRTGILGAPFTIDPGDLAGRTYLLDLVGAEWVEPPGLGGVLQQFFTTPILLGVRYADESLLDMLGAPGYVDELGVVTQNTSTPTWDFPITDFTDQPYFETEVELITLGYSGVDIPVEGFSLEITFSADGNSLGGGILAGLGDSRNVGQLLGDDDPNLLCELAAGLGVTCEPCADGQSYCLHMVGQNISGSVLPGVVLVEIN